MTRHGEDGLRRTLRCSSKLLGEASRRVRMWACCCAARRKEEVERGQVLCAKPGTITSAHASSRRRFMCLTKDEGGRHTPFFSKGYRPQFFFRTT